MLEEGGRELVDLVLAQDLGSLWHHHLQAGGVLDSLPADWIEELRRARVSAAVGYLAQRTALGGLDNLFAVEGIPYVVMKGGQVRECVYPDPALRPASDIDILISPADRRRASQVLVDAGYAAHVKQISISHEATFSRGAVDIDVHWNILRPGRTRTDLTAELLRQRQRLDGFWGLSDEDVLFLMLTHPAFSKYVCSPKMGLGRVADFLLWVQKRDADWPTVLLRLEQAGLKTAAWVMLSWFRTLATPEIGGRLDAWIGTVRPGRLRAAYLSQWLQRDLPSRWLERMFLIRFGFTLPLHDRLGDMLRALTGLQQARRHQLRDARLLMGERFAFEGGAAQ